jgi:hypothetical protein
MLTRYQSHMKKSWTFVENLGIVWEKEADMAHAFPPVTSRIDSRSRFAFTEFEPLLNSEQAADLLQIHHKTLQKLARRGEIRGTHIGKMAVSRVRLERVVQPERARCKLTARLQKLNPQIGCLTVTMRLYACR